MDFAPSAAQQMLASTAREFLRRHCPPERVQAWALDERGFDEPLWRRMAELGWPGLLVEPALGGSGGSMLDVVLLVEEMGYACLPGPFVQSAVVATSLLAAAGSAEQQKRLLPALAAGERIATVALTEESGSGDPDDVALGCRLPGRVTGRKLFVKDAHVADVLVVVVREGEGLSLALLPTDRPGISRLPLDPISGEKTFEVVFEDVEVVADDRLGPAGLGGAFLAPALRAGALARTAEMVGGAQRILDLVVEHARTRVQGGRPIGGYQAIQHACADLVRDVDTTRGLLRLAAWETAEGLPAASDVAMAKAHAAEACLAVARRGHQIFGAIGYCEEHLLHLLHKRIHAAALDFGDRQHHLETVARSMGLK
ncbi:MAG TPA: acyl-CoA dehydrogenase family protein [Methylomirabilota bacterium]|nr:acyl-CoA dehydrogenase family protein [Methylomirabilota bacterium]